MSVADQIAAAASDAGGSNVVPQTVSLADQIAAAAQSAASPSSPTNAPTYSPIGSNLQNFEAGAGKAVVDLGRGASQILRSGVSMFPGGAGLADKLGLTTQADVDAANKLDAPLMATKAGIGGDIAGNVAATMIPVGIAARAGIPLAASLLNPTSYTAAAASGALNGALQPTGTGDNRAGNMALGALAGGAGNLVSNTIGRVAQPIANMLSPQQAKAVQVLQSAGVPLDAAQQTGSPLLGAIRSSFSDNPFTRGIQAEGAGTQQHAFNRAVLSTVGEPTATAATSDVMGSAQNRINGVFHDVLSRNNVTFGDATVNRIGAIQQAANDEEKGPVSNLANRLIGLVGKDGTAPGQQVYGIKTDLDRLASSPDSTLAYHARQLRSTVMDAVNDSLPPADQESFAVARQQFGNLKKIEPAIDKQGTGNISPSVLANTLGQKANRGASIYGHGNQDLVNLAQSGKQLLGDKMPNSGTTARAAMQLALPVLAGGAGAYYGSNDGGTGEGIRNAALAAGTMIAAPRVAQRLMSSPVVSDYLANGVSGPLRSLLLAPQTSQMIGGAMRRLPGSTIRALQPATQQ